MFLHTCFSALRMRTRSIVCMCLGSVERWKIPSAGTTTNKASAHQTRATSVQRSPTQAGGITSVSTQTSMASTTRYSVIDRMLS